jgi:glutamate 5-kinase
MDGKEVGTLCLPVASPLNSRKHWIAYTLKARGRVFIDEGATEAIVREGKSLLPSGVTKVEGDFDVGDPVACVDPSGSTVAKGLVNYGAEDLRKIMGLKSTKIEQVLGHKDYDEVIHRDNLAVTATPAQRS